jgi:hypothetical protein
MEPGEGIEPQPPNYKSGALPANCAMRAGDSGALVVWMIERMSQLVSKLIDMRTRIGKSAANNQLKEAGTNSLRVYTS